VVVVVVLLLLLLLLPRRRRRRRRRRRLFTKKVRTYDGHGGVGREDFRVCLLELLETGVVAGVVPVEGATAPGLPPEAADILDVLLPTTAAAAAAASQGLSRPCRPPHCYGPPPLGIKKQVGQVVVGREGREKSERESSLRRRRQKG
jgi:hypothetical protein